MDHIKSTGIAGCLEMANCIAAKNGLSAQVEHLESLLKRAWVLMPSSDRMRLVASPEVSTLVEAMGATADHEEFVEQSAGQLPVCDGAKTDHDFMSALLVKFPGLLLDTEVSGGNLVDFVAAYVSENFPHNSEIK